MRNLKQKLQSVKLRLSIPNLSQNPTLLQKQSKRPSRSLSLQLKMILNPVQ
ncbi:hypothetical protein HSBGL_1394 [Halapricum desulfuricans]|uniref:Uncharacterized protein n=1 Tax=Halapricum desulfuricans TaxID=2841257 RepID=A0A897NLJ9_9EURY|nr:hypothetical protein HSBGL_1394 [Halapricum desulfuricans]